MSFRSGATSYCSNVQAEDMIPLASSQRWQESVQSNARRALILIAISWKTGVPRLLKDGEPAV
jgi:hypothetical protein